jgi:hypothetical protein
MLHLQHGMLDARPEEDDPEFEDRSRRASQRPNDLGRQASQNRRASLGGLIDGYQQSRSHRIRRGSITGAIGDSDAPVPRPSTAAVQVERPLVENHEAPLPLTSAPMKHTSRSEQQPRPMSPLPQLPQQSLPVLVRVTWNRSVDVYHAALCVLKTICDAPYTRSM